MKLAHGGRRTPRLGRGGKRLAALGVLGVGALLLSGCSGSEVVRFGWPNGITPESKDMLHLWQWCVIAALAVGVLVWGLTFWTVAFHRKKAGDDSIPRQTAYNVPLELTYTAIPFVMVAVLFYFTVIVQNNVEAKKADPAVTIDVTAFQWNWKFGYRDVKFADGSDYNGFERTGSPFEFQKEEPKTDEEKHPLPDGGRSDEVRNYLNFNKIETIGSSQEIPVLVLPVGRRIEFQIASADVIHSFWVPEFLFKRDVMPFPKQQHTDDRFQVSSIDKEGAFVGRCAEMCGTYHSQMNFEVRAVSEAKFDAYIKYRSANPQAGNAEALKAICEQPLSVSTFPFQTQRSTSGSGTPSKTGDTSNTTLPNCTAAQGA
ncbi:aa3-type cytochrome oxidase subunit II [Williamsia sterculiae]|uniref:aa3-type cytochrome oxidase subunit II n=1 Tax=Williamsia sterculiae TaxID=1344003 RepID=UPI000971136C